MTLRLDKIEWLAPRDTAIASDAQAPSMASRFLHWRQRVDCRFQTFRFNPLQRYVIAGLVVSMYIAATALSATRQLWHDELYTYYIAKAPSIPQLFRELRLDLNPPLEYLAVRLSLAVFGDGSFATRLPSIVAFFVGSVCFFRFVSKRFGELYGLLCVLAFWSTPFFAYATEARPYALIIAWFGIATLAWDAAGQPTRSRLSVLLLAIAVAGLMISHLFSLLYLTPFCLAEAWKLYRTRRFDWPVWLALLWPAIVPLAFLKLILRFQASLFPAIFEASPRRLAAFYYHTALPELPALLLALGLAALVGFRREGSERNSTSRIAAPEVAYTLGLLLIPAIVLLVLMKTHGAFFPRYGILSGFGIALVFVFAVARLTSACPFAAAVACCVLFLYDTGAIASAYDVHSREKRWPVQETALDRVQPDMPLVIASGLTFFEMSAYAMPATAQRLYYLTDRRLAIKYAHASMFQDFPYLKKYFPIRGTIEPYQQFVREHPQFLVFGSPEYPEDWLLRCLYDVHAKVQPAGIFVGPYKDFQLFQITMPGSQGYPRARR